MSTRLGPNYMAWEIDASDFPKSGTLQEKIAFVVSYGILAPSVHNTQPWSFTIDDDKLAIRPNNTRDLPHADPEGFGRYFAIGACARNIEIAAQHFGMATSLNYHDSGVTMQFKNSSKRRTAYPSFESIQKRYSNKLPYVPGSLESSKVKELGDQLEDDIEIVVVTDLSKREEVVKLHLEAAKATANEKEFVEELTVWLQQNSTSEDFGMPGFVMGNSNMKTRFARQLLKKKPEVLARLIKNEEKLLNSSSAFIVLGIKNNSKASWLMSGRVGEEVWLKLTDRGMVGHPMAAMVSIPAYRNRLAKILGMKSTPVFFMRIGYSNTKPYHTPRYVEHGKTMKTLDALNRKISKDLVTRQISIGKYRINYAVLGEGRPIVLIHGANIGYAQWHLNLNGLAKNFKVYALDIPGAGASTRVNFRKADFEKDYVNIVDKFIQELNLKEVDIVGSSFGGWIALRLAIKNRAYIRRVVVANPIGFTRYMPPKFRPISIAPLAHVMSKTALRPSRNNKNLEKFMRDVFFDKNTFLEPEFIDYFYELSQESHNVKFISRLAHYSGMRKELFLGNDLKKVKAPTLVIWGKEDELMPYDTVKDNFKLVPDVQVETLSKIGHMPPVEAPDKFNEIVTKFLKAK